MDFFPFINGKIEVFLKPVNVLFGHVASHVVKNENLRLCPHDSVCKRTQTVNTTMKLALVCLLT